MAEEKVRKEVTWQAWPGTWEDFRSLRADNNSSGTIEKKHRRMVTLEQADVSQRVGRAWSFWNYQDVPLPARAPPKAPKQLASVDEAEVKEEALAAPSRRAPSIPSPNRAPPSIPAPSRRAPTRPVTEEEKKQRSSKLDKYDTILVDCDGVLWLGDSHIEGAADTINALTKAGKRVAFVTNNSTKSRRMYVEKLASAGIEATVDQIYSSARSVAQYLQQSDKFDAAAQSAVVMGGAGLREELTEAGISVNFVAETVGENHLSKEEIGALPVPQNLGAVVVGLDVTLTYSKVAYTAKCIHLSPEGLFVATNVDSTLPTSTGLFPGTGSCVDMVIAAAMKKPVYVGKPETAMFDMIKQTLDVDPSKTLVIGDRLNTDIKWGNASGLDTALVLTGVTSESDLFYADESDHPTFVVPSISHIL